MKLIKKTERKNWLVRIRGIHGKLASAAGISKCRVKCEKCGREQDMDGAKALARGWPECHGYTMTLMRHKRPKLCDGL